MGYPYISLTQNITTASTSSPYAANQIIGTGINALYPVPANGFLQSVVISAKSTVSAQIDFMMFNSSMPNSTFTNFSSIAISSIDAPSAGSVVNVTNWAYGGTACSVGTANALAYGYYAAPISFSSAGVNTVQGRALYYALVARAALQVNSASDFTVTVTIVS